MARILHSYFGVIDTDIDEDDVHIWSGAVYFDDRQIPVEMCAASGQHLDLDILNKAAYLLETLVDTDLRARAYIVDYCAEDQSYMNRIRSILPDQDIPTDAEHFVRSLSLYEIEIELWWATLNDEQPRFRMLYDPDPKNKECDEYLFLSLDMEGELLEITFEP
ncbi:MAG: hypothetical protein Q4C87_08740 [Actinomycetaceae bacterium]|nr:hypothetical protein [Actinomycetaceae bacterium]